MRATVSKWGNSLGIRVPRDVAADLHLGEGSVVEIERRGDGYLIKPTGRAPLKHYRLSDLVAKIRDESRPEELEWGPPRGSEVW